MFVHKRHMSFWELPNQRNGQLMVSIKTILILLSFASICNGGVVADTLFLECRGENQYAWRAVATVIYNRAKERNLTYEQVCLQPAQFSCWNNGYYKPVPIDEVERMILGHLETLEDQMYSDTFYPIEDINHYHSISVKPYWADHMINVLLIGTLKFGKC